MYRVYLIFFYFSIVSCFCQKPNSFVAVEKYLRDSCHTTGLLILKKGEPVYHYGNIKEISYLASCRKSVLTILYGPFVENGSIRLEETIAELGIEDIGGLLPVEKQATISQILQSRSGIYHAASNEGDASAKAPPRGSVKPGAFWLYNNWDFNVAGYILEKKTGRNVYQLLDSILARPLGFEDWDIQNQRKFGDSTRSIYPAYHMFLSTRDMAKIGQLMLQQGNWKGKQIISKNWIKKITTPVTSLAEAKKAGTAWFDFSYGYYWWIWDHPANKKLNGAYTATGAFGQFITVIPKLDLVIAHKTKYPANLNTPPEKYWRMVDLVLNIRY